MVGVQVIGGEAVVQRYEKLQAESWALFQGKQFIVSGKGCDDLAEWLVDFEKTGTTATYTLRAYEGDAPTASSATADYIAALNFKLVDMYEGQGIAGHTTKLMQRLDAIEKKLNAEDQDNSDDDEEESIGDVIMGWLEQPEKLNQVIGAIKSIWSSDPQRVVAAIKAPGQSVGAFGKPQAMTNEEKLIRLSKALDMLEVHDPKLVEHLEKLAKLATDSPLIFETVISKLDAL